MQNYINEVSLVILNFQYIEQALRMYISAVNDRIKEKMKGVVPFKYNYKWVSKDSLGTLIDKFKKINENQDLINKLERLVPHRNEAIHKGLLLTIEEQNDKLFTASYIKELNKLRSQTRAVLFQILDEIKQIR